MRRIVFMGAASVMLAVSVFAQVTDRTFPTGLSFAPPAEIAKVPRGSAPLTGLLPPSIDLSSNFPVPGDQGQQGSCVGWAVAAVKSYQERIERDWTFNDDTLFSPSYVYNHAKVSVDCMAGAFYTTALTFVESAGAAPLSAFPYSPATCSRLASETERQTAFQFRIGGYARIEPGDPFEMKAHLAAGRPVLVGMVVDRTFMNLGRSIYQGLTGAVEGGHAMVVVGYDDARGAYKVLNSWGQDWSENGFGWIAYAVFPAHRNIVREAYVATDAPVITTFSPAVPPPPSKESGAERTVSIVYRRPVATGTRSETSATRDHHCSFNCAGEPTRTPYTLGLTAAQGRLLRNPRLVCEGVACPWSAISYLRVQGRGAEVQAGWSVWGHPTVWRLEAEEYEIQEYRQEQRRVRADTSLEVTTDPADAEPVISVNVNNRPIRVGPGLNALAARAYFIGREERQGTPTYTFKIERP